HPRSRIPLEDSGFELKTAAHRPHGGHDYSSQVALVHLFQRLQPQVARWASALGWSSNAHAWAGGTRPSIAPWNLMPSSTPRQAWAGGSSLYCVPGSGETR